MATAIVIVMVMVMVMGIVIINGDWQGKRMKRWRSTTDLLTIINNNKY